MNTHDNNRQESHKSDVHGQKDHERKMSQQGMDDKNKEQHKPEKDHQGHTPHKG